MGAALVETEPDGKHTRTMIIDITARVLAEREKARLLQQNLYLQEEIKAENNFEEIIGALARRCARSSSAIEQVAADRLHRPDPRRDRHRQGADRARDPQPSRAAGTAR